MAITVGAGSPVQGAGANCLPAPEHPVSYVQVTSMRLNAGEQTFESFRITRGGRVEWARWNSAGYLLDHAPSTPLGDAVFDQILAASDFSSPQSATGDSAVLGRPAFGLEVSLLADGRARFMALDAMPRALAELTGDLRRRIAPRPLEPGWYIWTKPAPAEKTTDIALSGSTCDTAVGRALADAVASGALIVRGDESLRDFKSGEHASRMEFSVKTTLEHLRFGVVLAK